MVREDTARGNTSHILTCSVPDLLHGSRFVHEPRSGACRLTPKLTVCEVYVAHSWYIQEHCWYLGGMCCPLSCSNVLGDMDTENSKAYCGNTYKRKQREDSKLSRGKTKRTSEEKNRFSEEIAEMTFGGWVNIGFSHFTTMWKTQKGCSPWRGTGCSLICSNHTSPLWSCLPTAGAHLLTIASPRG